MSHPEGVGTNGQIPGMAEALCGQSLQRYLDLGKAETGAPHKVVGTCAECAPLSANRSADKPAVAHKFSTYEHLGQLGHYFCIMNTQQHLNVLQT